MKKGRHYSEQEIRLLAQSVIGKTFNEIKQLDLVTIDDTKIQKGSLGGIIEEALYGIEPNGESEPDFIDAGIELKVTPYRKNKDNTLSAKERLVLNMIDFMTEYPNEFKFSHFWFKNNKLEIIWYMHEDDKNKYDFKVTNELLFDLSLCEDIKQIEKDYYTITKKIRDGKAHELSEADTMYLGACTKGANSNDVRTQPFSNIPAKRRAFCFKSSYMTQLVRKYIGDYSNVEKIINNDISFDDFVDNVINKYKGLSQQELIKNFEIESTAKNLNGIIVSRMFGIKGDLSKTDEFLKANIIPRTIRIEESGRIKESLPFPAFKYTDIVNQEWEESDLKETLESTKYMFFVFKMVNNEYIFKGIKLWNIPELELENEVKKVWLKTKEIVRNGNIVKEVDSNGIRNTNFPGMSENRICHVRPHARDAQDTNELPVKDILTGADKYTKHCFWINSKYLEEILSEFM